MFFVMVFCHGILVGDWDAQDKPWISIGFLFPKGALKRPESQRLLQRVLALDVLFFHGFRSQNGSNGTRAMTVWMFGVFLKCWHLAFYGIHDAIMPISFQTLFHGI